VAYPESVAGTSGMSYPKNLLNDGRVFDIEREFKLLSALLIEFG
jgi:hypothetical protein